MCCGKFAAFNYTKQKKATNPICTDLTYFIFMHLELSAPRLLGKRLAPRVYFGCLMDATLAVPANL